MAASPAPIVIVASPGSQRSGCLSPLFARTAKCGMRSDWPPVGSPPLNKVSKNGSLNAPRAGFEPATYCLGGISAPSPDVPGCRLTCCLAATIIAKRGLVSPGVCLYWLPVWLPRTSAVAHVRIPAPAVDQQATAGYLGALPCSRTCSRRTRADPICGATGGHLARWAKVISSLTMSGCPALARPPLRPVAAAVRMQFRRW